MKKLLLLLVLSCTVMLSATTSQASHISGGDISYTCIGQDSFLISLSLFRDCSGISMSTTQTVTFTSTCGGSITVQLQAVPNPVTGLAYTNISQLCGADSMNSTCFGGPLPGMQEYVYEAIVVLPPCDTWTMGWSTCCRNTTVNVPGSNSANVYIEATMNSVTAPCNSSPAFTAQPIPYVCVNQLVSYNYGVTEINGDSLVYSIIGGMTGAGTPLLYGAPTYTAGSPIPGITIDPQTGQLIFTPTVTGNFIIAVLVEEYDAAGNLLGTVMRDIQFVVQNCTNIVPTNPVSIGNVTGQGNQIGNYAVELCEGTSVCFDVTFGDVDGTDTLTYTSNINTVLPGATVVATGTNPLTLSICWLALSGSPTFNAFTIDVNDGACPIAGITSLPIEVHVVTSTYAGPDQIICGTQSANINASGGSIFDWTVLSGPPMNVGTDFSCTPCANPIATPTATTTYLVTSDLSGNCVNTDTITISVVPDYTWTIASSAGQACLLEDIDLTVTPNPAGAYTYQWSPSAGLNNPTIPNPTASVITPGTNTYTVTMTSALGCVLQDNISFTVAPNYQPTVFAGIDTTLSCTDSMFFSSSLAPPIPVTCGLSTTGCSGTPSVLTIGGGLQSNGTTTYPAPYGNFYWGSRHQILVLASELQAQGFSGGQLTELAFNVNYVSGATVYNGWEVRMGCTNQTQLSNWESGLVTVLPANNITVGAGWNTYTFTNAFDWDGMSNVVVEICFNNSAWDDNSSTFYTTTPFNSVLYYRADNATVCYSGTPTTSADRPNIRFTTCGGQAPPGTYSYSWTGTTPVSDPTILNPTAHPLDTAQYILTVTDIAGGCSDSDTINVFVDCGDCQPPQPTSTPPSCNGASDATITATPLIVYNPVIFEWYDFATNTLLQTSAATTQPDVLANIPAGQYLIVITDTALQCTEDTLVTILDPPIPTISVSNDTTVCMNGTATFSAQAMGGNGAPFTINWNNGLVGTGPHAVVLAADDCIVASATDVNGCPTALDSVCITLLPPLTVTTSGDDSICAGDIASISALATGGSGTGYTFTWEDANGNPVGTGSGIDVIPTQSPMQYCVTVMDDCETTPEVVCLTIYFHQQPQVSFTSDSPGGCVPQDIVFTNTTPAGQVGSVVWDMNLGQVSTNTGTATASYLTPGCYDISLQVTSPEGCVSDTTYVDFICTYGYPTAAFNFGPQPTSVLNSTIHFDNTSIDNTSNWWSFFNGVDYDTSSVENPSYMFPDFDPGSYDVSLIVSNQWGCLDSISQTVVIDGEYVLYVPNSFTPDGNGINDIFIPQGDGINLANYNLLIYNRWGNLVFETDDATKGWDGTVNGTTPAQVDVYVWKLVTEDIWTTDVHEYFGSINLIR